MSLHGAFASMHSHGGPPPSGSAVPIRRPPLPLPLPLHRLHERGGRREPLRRFAQIALDDPGPRMVIRSAEPYRAMLGREEEATVPTNHQSISCTSYPQMMGRTRVPANRESPRSHADTLGETSSPSEPPSPFLRGLSPPSLALLKCPQPSLCRTRVRAARYALGAAGMSISLPRRAEWSPR
jgi:hypothetical protein